MSTAVAMIAGDLGFLTLRVGMLPGRVVDVQIPSGGTVRDALQAANLQVGDGQEVRVAGQKAELDSPVVDNARIMVLGRTRGN